MPEPILNSDGKATQRLLNKLREDHQRLPLIIGGDVLFSDGTITEYILSLDTHYLFTYKPGDHHF